MIINIKKYNFGIFFFNALKNLMKTADSIASQALSRSQSTSGLNDQKSKIISGSYSSFDRIFPLLNETFKSGKVPGILENLLAIHIIFQIFAFSMWPAFTFLELTDIWDDQVGLWIYRIAFLSEVSKSHQSILIGFGIFSFLLLLIVISISIEVFIYIKTRRFIKASLSFARICFDIIPTLAVLPCSLWFGLCLKYSIKLGELFYIVFAVVSFLYLSAYIFLHYIQSYFSASLPFISPSNLCCWSGNFHFQLLFVPSVIMLFSYIVEFFPVYFSVILICIKMIFNIYMVYETFFFPFSHIEVNAVFASLFSAVNFIDVIKLIDLFDITVRFWVLFALAAGSFIIMFVICKLLFRRRIKRISSYMHEDAANFVDDSEPEIPFSTYESALLMLQDERLRKWFFNLGLAKSETKCEMFFRIGLAHRCPLFLNWSVIKFAGEFHRTPHMASIITQFISLYPCETRLLSAYFNQACGYPLNFSQRFLMFQINVIKGLRQSSASRDVAESIMNLRNKANTIIDDTRKFWLTCPDELTFFFDIQRRSEHLSELFAEALDRWPNNVRICEIYSHYLIEGTMDFKEGVKIKHRAELIEQGKNFVVDESFRSLVRAYPEYLKKNVMDIKGNFINHYSTSSANSSQSSKSNGSNISSGTIDGNLDPEIEESVAKNCFTYHRLRIEFQQCISNRKLKYENHLKYSVMWSFFLVFFFSCFFVGFYYHHYDQRLGSIQRQIDLNLVKYNFDAAFLMSTLLTFYSLGVVEESFVRQISVPPTGKYEIDFSRKLAEIAKFTDGASLNLSRFMGDIMKLAIEGKNVYGVFYEMISRVVPVTQCKGSNITHHTYNESLKEVFIKLLNYQRTMSTMKPSELIGDFRSCELLANVPSMAATFDLLANRVLNAIKGLEDTEVKLNTILIIAIPLSYLVASLPFIVVYLFLCMKELKRVHDMLIHLAQPIRETASRPMTKSDEEENTIKDAMRQKTMKSRTLYIIAFLPLINVALFVVCPVLSMNQNRVFNTYNYWIYYSCSRSHLALTTFTYTGLTVASTKPFLQMTKLTNFYHDVAKEYLDELNDNNNNLLRGSENAPSCVGVDSNLDALNIKKHCTDDLFNSTDHHDYKCSSLDSAITQLYSYLNLVLQDPDVVNITADEEMANAYHVTNSHILDRVWESSYEIFRLANKQMNKYRINIAIVSLGTLLLGFIITMILWVVFGRLSTAYKGELMELRRVSPMSMTSSQALMNYITHKDDQKKVEEMAPSKSVVYLSKDAVIFIQKNLNIEFINNSTTTLFGYTPDQLLGQPIHTVIPESNNEEFFKQIEMMKSGQCALVYEKSFLGLSDDEQLMPIHTTLIGIPDEKSNTPKAFVVIVRDESELINQRKVAENAKAMSEKLLYQILPRDIVVRLNRGETDINFTVPSATIVFIDIVKFSNYSATLNPSQIMEHLSIIFAKFDTLVHKYHLITKIKLIGDVYMAAGGLFTPEENPQNHASQVVNFGLETLVALEDANNQFNANLQVRIGVNTGGPLIAGVLGTDKPVFDIIGDPINVASRLQSTAIPGTVQISQETYDLINNMNYNLEKRGEIELKGKGKRLAYIVRPLAMSSFFSVPQEIDERV